MDNYDFSFGIDYDIPEKYLIPGEQSDLEDTYFEELKTLFDTPEKTISTMMNICNWFNHNFSFSNAGGSMIGKKTVNELYETKTYYGCHSAALVISSILREFGFPAVMIETASIDWAYDYNDNPNLAFGGHVMTEVYVEDKWILLDNNCQYIEDYSYLNPFISTAGNNRGLFVYAKGIDTWDYGVRDESDTHSMMINFADNLGCFEEYFNTVNYYWD
ncbi:transglutaminase-like domain-containing protein [Candidatus Neomarinimicrobiota bacterium]